MEAREDFFRLALELGLGGATITLADRTTVTLPGSH